MTTLIDVLEAILVGLAGRFGLFLLAGLALLLPALALALVWRATMGRRGAAVEGTGGVRLRRGAFYAPNHTWLAPTRPGELAVGLDDLAQRLLPSATAVELPRRGQAVHRGDPIAVVRAGGHAVHIGAPVDGEIVRVNGRVRRDPRLLKDEPYGAGWLFTIAPADGSYMRLPQDREANEWLRRERTRLARFVEAELGIAAADGGELLAPAPALLGEEGWRKVLSAFLHAA